MDRPIVLAVLYGLFVLGCALTLLVGNAGIREYAELERYHALLERNLHELESASAALVVRLEALRSNRETVKLLARQLGYLGEGERRIYLNTLESEPSFYQVGSVLTERRRPGLSTEPLNILTFAPLSAFFILMCVRLGRAGTRGRADR